MEEKKNNWLALENVPRTGGVIEGRVIMQEEKLYERLNEKGGTIT